MDYSANPSYTYRRHDSSTLTPISPVYDNPPRIPTLIIPKNRADAQPSHLDLQKHQPDHSRTKSDSPTLPETYPSNPQQYAPDFAHPLPSPASSMTKTGLEVPPPKKTVHFGPDENPLNGYSGGSPGLAPSGFPPITAGGNTLFDNHLPGQAQHTNSQIRGGTWRHGLWDCGDIGVCCTGVWCPCVIYGRTQYRLSQRADRQDPTNMLAHPTLNGSCVAFALLCGCNLVLAAIQHSRVRKTYEIPGGLGTDAVRACCCCCCTLSQDEKEVKFREGRARDVAAVPYKAPVGMSYAPPQG